ncbi:MAG: hypothetical protein JWN85_4938 [Gammaproteobacteria bacterium]|nr:hypothetical protein [Gammaproteobacteria bacterium]
MRRVDRTLLGVLGFLAVVSALSQRVRAADEASSGVLACAALGVDSERLRCYDLLAARLHADKNPLSRPVPPAPAKEVFGLRAAPEKPAPKALERAELNSVSARVTSVRQRPQGGVLVELDNGQLWQQLGNTDLLLEAGDNVTIARAALGSFSITTPHKRIAKVTRIR